MLHVKAILYLNAVLDQGTRLSPPLCDKATYRLFGTLQHTYCTLCWVNSMSTLGSLHPCVTRQRTAGSEPCSIPFTTFAGSTRCQLWGLEQYNIHAYSPQAQRIEAFFASGSLVAHTNGSDCST
jgi:hypothetical protein